MAYYGVYMQSVITAYSSDCVYMHLIPFLYKPRSHLPS